MELLHRPRKPLAELAGLVLLLVFLPLAPLPYGGIQPEGTLFIQLFSFTIGAAAFVGTRSPRPLGPVWLPLASITGIALIGGVQLLPMPMGLLASVSPASARLYEESARILEAFGRTPGNPPRISIAPQETVASVLLFLSCVVLFGASARLLKSRSRRRLFLASAFLAALLQIGIAAFSQGEEVRRHGSFVNPNHLAGYLQVALALSFGVILAVAAPPRRHQRQSAERRLVTMSGAVLLWGVLAAGLGLTRSRGGILAAALTTIVLLTLAVLERRVTRRRALPAAVLLMAGLGFAVAITRSDPLLRFLGSDPRDIGQEGRRRLWELSLQAYGSYPIFGSGLGTFREAFRAVQPRELDGFVEQAHSDPLQLLVTGGAVSAALAALALLSGLAMLLRAWERQLHREERALCLGGIGALLALALHGLVEFNFSLPAIPALLACALGAAWAAGSWSQRDDEDDEDGLDARREAPRRVTAAPRTDSTKKTRRPARPVNGTESRDAPDSSSEPILPPSNP